MATFDIQVEEGGLGVKLSPEPISSKVFCLRVVGINDPVRAERAMLQAGDLLYAVNGITFTDPKEFLQWVRMPPYMLTVLRKEEGLALPAAFLEGSGASGSASSSSAGAAAGGACSSAGAGAAPAAAAGSGAEGLVEQALQRKLPKGWLVGKATGVDSNCLVDSLLQLLFPELDEGARAEQARTCRAALVEQGLCKEREFLRAAHVPHVLAMLGVAPETTTVFVIGFMELEQRVTPERVGCGTGRLLFLANVSRHTHMAPISTADQRIEEGLQVLGALEEAREREQALDGLVRGLLGYDQAGAGAGG